MCKVFLIRHGETEWNRQEIFRGRLDIGLNKNGLRQAQAVALALKMVRISAVYSSPLRRAYQTAQAITQKRGLIVQMHAGLIDINFGKWQGLSHNKVKRQYPKLYKRWYKEPDRVRFPEGESLAEVKERTVDALTKLCRQHHSQDNIAIISHRVVNKVILCTITGLDNSHFWQIKQDTACINIFDYTELVTIELINDTCHLKKSVMIKTDF